MSLDDIDRIMSDTADAISYQEARVIHPASLAVSLTLLSSQEIEAALGAKLTSEDEADIERQLEELAAAQTAADVTSRLPDAPSTPLPAAGVAENEPAAAAAVAAAEPARTRKSSERRQQLAA